jgi:CTP:molybdopterin cytidylyltransferase MocA
MNMVGVLLTAGASRRMGRPKALEQAGRQSYAARGIRTLWSACDTVVMVLGAGADGIRERTEQEFARLAEAGKLAPESARVHDHVPDQLEVRFVTNLAWKRGMLSSVRVGLKEALGRKPEGVVVMPVDHPSVKTVTIGSLAVVMHEAVKAAAAGDGKSPFSYALVPRYRGERGHPVVLSPALARAVAKDDGARDLSDSIRRHARLVGYLDVKDAGVVHNVNRPGERSAAKR